MFGKPESLNTESTKASSVEISWSAPFGDGQPVAEYIVTWDPPGSDGMASDTTVVELILIDNLSSNTKYVINVAARAEVGGKDGEYSNNFEAITCKSTNSLQFQNYLLRHNFAQ